MLSMVRKLVVCNVSGALKVRFDEVGAHVRCGALYFLA